jgi:hypothetical protein
MQKLPTPPRKRDLREAFSSRKETAYVLDDDFAVLVRTFSLRDYVAFEQEFGVPIESLFKTDASGNPEVSSTDTIKIICFLLSRGGQLEMSPETGEVLKPYRVIRSLSWEDIAERVPFPALLQIDVAELLADCGIAAEEKKEGEASNASENSDQAEFREAPEQNQALSS